MLNTIAILTTLFAAYFEMLTLQRPAWLFCDVVIIAVNAGWLLWARPWFSRREAMSRRG